MLENTKAEFVVQEPLYLRPEYKALLVDVKKKKQTIKFKVYDMVKRGLDLIMAAVMLIVLSPIFLILTIAIRIDSPGPAIFRQKRTGRNGKEFNILKFRRMTKDNDINDCSCEDKCTRVGRVIRKTSLDELPQLIKVLVGQMSFIGPRPWVTEYWTNMNEEERQRGRVRPGITGLAAAKGRNGLTVFERIAYDLEYVKNYSLWQDIKIIFITIKTVLSHEEYESGKSGVHDDIEDLKAENKKLETGVVIKTDSLVNIVMAGQGEEMAGNLEVNRG